VIVITMGVDLREPSLLERKRRLEAVMPTIEYHTDGRRTSWLKIKNPE